jgi:hypothetical protein
MSYLVFFKNLYLVIFYDEIKFENFKKSPKNRQEEGNLKGLSHEIDFKNVDKNLQNLA